MIKKDVMSRKVKDDPKSEYGWFGSKAFVLNEIDGRDLTIDQLMNKMCESNYIGLHEVLSGNKYRPYADLDWSEGITRQNFEQRKYEILSNGFKMMERLFPDSEVNLFCSSGKTKDGKWKVSGHYICTGVYYTDKLHIKWLLQQELGDPTTWKAKGWDESVYSNDHCFRLPGCTKPGDKRVLRFAELFNVGDIQRVVYGKMDEDGEVEEFKMDEGTICAGLITYVEYDETEMPKPDGYVEPVQKEYVAVDGQTDFTDAQKATRFENMKKLIAALAPHRANNRKTWSEGLWAIRRCAEKVGQRGTYLALAHEFSKKTDGGNYSEASTIDIYMEPVKEIGVGYKRLKEWADEDTPGWDAAEDFTIDSSAAEFNIELLKEKIKLVKTAEHLRKFKDAVVEYMNKYCTLVKAGRKPYIIWEKLELNLQTKEIEQVQDYRDVKSQEVEFMNKTLEYKLDSAKATEPASELCPLKCWLKHPNRREVDRVYMNPNPALNDPKSYNIYKGPGISREACKDAPALTSDSPWLQHIRKRWCHDNEKLYNNVLDRFALQIQKPWIKQKVGQGLMSPEGSGKGIVVQPIFRIVGMRYIAIPTTSDQILGKFNALMTGKLIVFLDELTWGGDKEREGALKRLCTEDLVALERKGIDPVQVDNPANVIACSNEDWMLPASRKARRFQVVRLSEELAGSQTAETEKLIEEIVAVSDHSIAKFFYDRDIAGFNPKKIIATEALRSQKIESMSQIDQSCYTILNRGVVKIDGVEAKVSGAEFKKSDFYDSIGAPMKFMNDSKYWKHLQSLWPSLEFTRPMENRKRMLKVKFPTLEVMQAEFRKAYDDEEWVFDEADEDEDDDNMADE